MPPLVSDDLDDYSEDSKMTSTNGSNGPGNVTPAIHPNDAAADGTSDNEKESLSEQDAPGEDDIMDDNDLIAQLQRSAQQEDGAEEPADTSVQPSQNGDPADGVAAEESGEEGNEETSAAEEEGEDGAEEEAQSSAGGESSSSDGEAESSSSESEESESDEESEATSSEEDEVLVDQHCLFCDKAENNETGDDTDNKVTCSRCANAAHKQCAIERDALKADEDISNWRCPSCGDKSTESESPRSVLARARNSNSAPRLVRDLLPVSRGVQKPNSHSIFAQPLLSDGEEGGRSLRKRKSPTQEPPTMEKRRRKTTPKAPEGSLAQSTPKDRAVAHSTRSALQPQRPVPVARILQHRPFNKPPPHKFILAFRLGQDRIESILSKPPRPGRPRIRKRQQAPKIPPPPIYQAPVPKFPALPSNNLVFPSLFGDKDPDAKPYGGILSEQEADTSRSLPQYRDREIFEIARKEAEEERQKASEAAEAEINGENSATGKPNRTVSGPPSKIKCIQFGKYVIDTFYAAPYPEEYSHEARLFICEFCLKYLPSEFVAYRHKLKCPAKHPPGDEIYRDGSISIWEVDGRKKTEYCQCLCLMAKMFLGSKTLYYDVEPFLFYILTEYDETGYHFVGYFSKEKRPASQNNVSCILVMPIHQRKGYATFLIDFSYLLTRIEGKEGSPEKPLSDMGLTAYRAYWDLTVSKHLLELNMKPFSTKTLMARTGMTADDVIHSLERLYAFTRDPQTKTYAIRYDGKLYESIVSEHESKKHRALNPDMLVWTPYVMGRSDQAQLDGQPLQTIAPRDEDLDNGDDEPSDAGKENHTDVESASPRTQATKTLSEIVAKEDPALIDDNGIVAPGPPSTEALTTKVPTEAAIDLSTNGTGNGEADIKEQTSQAADEQLSGYALAYRTLKIPPMRFQITPPIPASMLRNRSTKKRSAATAFARANGNGVTGLSGLTSAPATRSSPRNAGSVNGQFSRGGSEEKVATPVRRSGRKSGLANVELMSLDGTNEQSDAAESGMAEAETPGLVTEQNEEVEGSESESEEEGEEDEDAAEDDVEDEIEVDDDDDEKDPDAEVEEDESSSDEESNGDGDEGAAEVADLVDEQADFDEDEDEDAPAEDDD
jgi:histone acetyltransferase SAS3